MKRKKLILAFLIVNFLILLGFSLILGITYREVPPADGERPSINLKSLILLCGGLFLIIALLEGFLGIFTYKGKKWAAVGLLVCEFIIWIGIFGTVAAIIQLINPCDYTEEIENDNRQF